MIVSPQMVGNASNFTVQTLVDGVIRKDSNTNDLVFAIEELIVFIRHWNKVQ